MGKKEAQNPEETRYNSYLIAEIVKLKKLQKFIREQEQDIIKLYLEIFPKKCVRCEKVYSSREEYLQNTSACTIDNTNADKEERDGKVLEYRNCVCHARLVIMMTCRRDQTIFGQRRRALYQRCVRKLINKDNLSRHEAELITRNIFQECVEKNALYHKVEQRLEERIF